MRNLGVYARIWWLATWFDTPRDNTQLKISLIKQGTAGIATALTLPTLIDATANVVYSRLAFMTSDTFFIGIDFQTNFLEIWLDITASLISMKERG